MAVVLITREAGRGDALAAQLREAGHLVHLVPLIATVPLGDDPIPLDPYDWVVVTSVTGARELRRRATGRWPSRAAIGAVTAEALGGAELVPRIATQEGLLAEFPASHGRVLFAGAEGARRLLADELNADFVALYRTTELTPELPAADVAVVASPSAARALARVWPAATVVSIGPETTREAREQGLEVRAEATRPETDSLAGAVERALQA